MFIVFSKSYDQFLINHDPSIYVARIRIRVSVSEGYGYADTAIS